MVDFILVVYVVTVASEIITLKGLFLITPTFYLKGINALNLNPMLCILPIIVDVFALFLGDCARKPLNV